MSIATTFVQLAQGRQPANDGLLGNCRMEWAGAEAYGEEAVLESFRINPLAPDDGLFVSTGAQAGWVGADSALIADVYDGHIGRLWRLGAGVAPPREPAVSVAFDPDLQQQRGGVNFHAGDHPELDASAIPFVIAAGEELVGGESLRGLHRARAFVLRAFSSVEGTIALYAVHRLGGGDVRSSGFGFAVAAVAPDGRSRIVLDQPIATPWVPRL